MARSKRGFRPIVVEGTTYHWRVSAEKTGLSPHARVEVASAAHFERGRKAQRLVFTVALPYLIVPHARFYSWEVYEVAITPRRIAEAIATARRAAPPFTGADRAQDVTLAEKDTRAIFAVPIEELIPRILERAAAGLRGVPSIEVFMARMLALAAVHERAVVIARTWVAPHVERFHTLRSELRAYAGKLAREMSSPRYGDGALAPADVAFRERCAQRSAIQFFNEWFGETLGWTIDASEADVFFDAMPEANDASIPEWAPIDHTWWRRDPLGP